MAGTRSQIAALAGALALLSALCALACEDRAVISSGDGCTANRDCSLGEVCVAGQCTPAARQGCRGDDECEPDEFCDPATRECTPRALRACTGDMACPAHQRCDLEVNMCVDRPGTCRTEEECTRGYHCDLALLRCVECTSAAHCDQGERCEAGACVTGTSTAPSSDAGVGDGAPPADAAPGSDDASQLDSGPAGPDVGPGAPDSGVIYDCPDGDDYACAPPLTVCVDRFCVPGCGQMGGFTCGAREVCDTTAGRCIPILGPCMNDSECRPPDFVCEGGQCVGGCAQAGGLQCSGGTVCEPTTGRCIPGVACQDDVDCGPPASICDRMLARCEPGCVNTGCTAPDICNQVTGRCGDGELFSIYSETSASSPAFAAVMPAPVTPPSWSPATLTPLTGMAPEGQASLRFAGVNDYDALDFRWGQPIALAALVGGHLHLRLRVSPELATSGVTIAFGLSTAMYPHPEHIKVFARTTVAAPDLGTQGQWWDLRIPFTQSALDRITWTGGMNITRVDTLRVGNPGVMQSPWWFEIDDVYFSSRP